MAMGRETGVQGDLLLSWSELPRSPGHAFYGRLQGLLLEAGFDAFVEEACKPFYAPRMGAPSMRSISTRACDRGGADPRRRPRRCDDTGRNARGDEAKNLTAAACAPTQEEPCEVVADKGYHSERFSKIWTAATGSRASLSRSRPRVICAGAARSSRA